jgi:hypothetical protein
MDSDFVLNDSQQPTGMSIGNELEIVEALEIMKDNQNKISELWDKSALSEQRNTVRESALRFIKLLMPWIRWSRKNDC